MLFWNRTQHAAPVGVGKPGLGTTKETSKDKEVVSGLTYPCAGNSNRITLPGVKTNPFFGGILGVILTDLLAYSLAQKI